MMTSKRKTPTVLNTAEGSSQIGLKMNLDLVTDWLPLLEKFSEAEAKFRVV